MPGGFPHPLENISAVVETALVSKNLRELGLAQPRCTQYSDEQRLEEYGGGGDGLERASLKVYLDRATDGH